jgi:tRNA (pseudouridine54-N1)-methyltransferase
LKRFAIIGHQAGPSGDFSLNDLPGSGGRIDILCRCANSSMLLSHGVREDVECYLVLAGDPEKQKTVRFSGSSIRSLSPDERSTGALIKKALSIPCGDVFRESSPGISVRQGGLKELLQEFSFAVLDEKGEDIRDTDRLPDSFLLSDSRNFTEEETGLISGLPAYSVGPEVLHADQAITVLLNEIDRRGI